jgi:V/A-type H+/Na+-transporting ATPase subunit E
MGIEEVRKEIIEDARNKAKQILKEGEAEKKEIFAAAESNIETAKGTIEKDAASIIAQHKSKQMAEVNSAAKKQRLLLEKELIDEVFGTAAGQLDKLSPKQREKHLNKILAFAGKNISGLQIHCSEKDAALLKKHKPQISEIRGGAVIEDTEGSTRLDISYEQLLGEIRQEELDKITKILFE